jgi:hypothetical protein
MRKISRTRARLAAATAVGGFAIVAAALATMASAAPASAGTLTATAMPTVTATPTATLTAIADYRFGTLDNAKDVTFNQLLGINNSGVIAGYFGSGAAGHPNKGYKLFPPYGQGNYANENFPGSVQTQVTGLNDKGDTVGFWSSMDTASMVNNNFGFYELNGHKFHTVEFPTGDNANPPVNRSSASTTTTSPSGSTPRVPRHPAGLADGAMSLTLTRDDRNRPGLPAGAVRVAEGQRNSSFRMKWF